MKARFAAQYALPAYDARTLTASRELATYYEAAVAALGGESKLVANWVQGEVSAALNRNELEIAAAPVSAQQLAGLLRRIADNTISGKIAKDVFDAMWAGEAPGDGAADAIIAQKGLKQISDEGAIARIVDEVLAANPAIVAEYRAGREKAFNSLVGKAMAASKGKANPAQVNALLKRKLGA
jgi:aspartyl-tRNA(Asn)/glutamyl-tRNA(Gln) amidotransferase subunit B